MYFSKLIFICAILIISRAQANDYSWSVDNDNDRVAIIDAKIREARNQEIEIAPTLVFDSQHRIDEYKKGLNSVTPSIKKPYALYKVQKGDTLESIAEKVYGNKDRWHELLEINETLLLKNKIEEGLELKYED